MGFAWNAWIVGRRGLYIYRGLRWEKSELYDDERELRKHERFCATWLFVESSCSSKLAFRPCEPSYHDRSICAVKKSRSLSSLPVGKRKKAISAEVLGETPRWNANLVLFVGTHDFVTFIFSTQANAYSVGGCVGLVDLRTGQSITAAFRPSRRFKHVAHAGHTHATVRHIGDRETVFMQSLDLMFLEPGEEES